MRNLPVIAWVFLGLLVLSAPLLGYGVHVALIKYCYLGSVRRLCRQQQWELLAWRAGYFFEESNGRRVKTEYTAFALDCRNSRGARKVVCLLVSVLGVKAVFGLPGFPTEAATDPEGGSRYSFLWERGSAPPPAA
jgi:hypothetical protein